MSFKVGDLIRFKEECANLWHVDIECYLIIDRRYGWKPLSLRGGEARVIDADNEYFTLLSPSDGICFEMADVITENYELVV